MSERDLLWRRVSPHPFICPQPGTLAPESTTTPDILIEKGRLFLIIGAVSEGCERLIGLSISPDNLKLGKATIESASIVLEAGTFDYDAKHVFDPALLFWKNQYFLYFSAIGLGDDTIGLATSKDGRTYIKSPTPILTGRSPEIVVHENQVYIFFVLPTDPHGYSIYGARSADGINFIPLSSSPILTEGELGEWDSIEVTTPRIFKLGDTFYMIYAGTSHPERKDLPDHFGLARSTNLLKWEKYLHNPVFSCGKTGTWDDGAIWFGTVFELNGILYMLYEGGRLQDLSGSSPGLTQVGLAATSLKMFTNNFSENIRF